MNAVDTNILIYVNDSRDPSKQAIAASLVAGLTDGVLIWQEANVETLYTEDFGYSDIDGLKIVNPFKSP